VVREKGEFQIRWKTDLPYKWAIGKLAVKYFEELKKRKITGSKCPKCGKMKLKRLISASSFRLVGSGWFRDGY